MNDTNDVTEKKDTNAATSTHTDGVQRRRTRRFTGLVVGIAGVLILILLGSTVVAVRSRLQSGSPSAPTAQPSTGGGSAAVRALIQKANQEQQQAFAEDKPTLMRDTATAAYYAELVKLDTALRSSGVTAIQLRSATFDQVVLQGNTAQSTTTETWQATYANGSNAAETSVNNYSLVLTSAAWKISGDTQPNTNVPPSSTSPSSAPIPSASPSSAPAPGTSPGSAPTTVGATSRNWSGYVASGATFTAVSGTWTVPTVSATGTGVDATWAGIGGATTTDLIQAGTQATVDNGVVQYSAWIETLPQASQTVPLTVNSGDTLTVSITEQSSNVWNISIVDATSGGKYSGTVTYASSGSSAEWIEEAPSSGRGVVLLDRFGTVQFTNASAVANQQTVTAAAAGAKPITMINGSGVQLAAPSALGTGGASFSVTRT
ncbi:MAG TPA: G1 family glutamic endopeptidase [Candidatus Dormibacteraeota bacterium]